MIGVIEKTRQAWTAKGLDLPDWVALLAAECEKSSQNKVAIRLNRSASLVSAVLAAKYTGDMQAVEDVVRGVFERATVECPRLGTIPANECRDWQMKARTFLSVNVLRRDMFRACNRCPRNGKETDK